MTRVLLLVTDLERGGTPMRVVRWAKWLRQAGVQPIVGCLATRGPLSDDLDASGIANFSCGARHRFDALALLRLVRITRLYNPDLIHGLLLHANLAARLVGRLGRRRPVITSTVTIEIQRRWHRWAEAWTHRLSDLHVVNAPSVARHVIDDLGVPPERVVTVPSGVDFPAIDASPPVKRAEWGLPADLPLIVWAGRMDPVKGLDTWVEVFDRLRRRLGVCGVLVGDGPLRKAVERDLDQRGIHGRPQTGGTARRGQVLMVGWSESLAGWLKTADVLLFPSRTEGNPNVVLEAMAARCCVVASGVGGCADLIRNGQTGWLCHPTDVRQFVEAVGSACRNDEHRGAVVNAARTVVERREAISGVVSGLLSAYRTTLSQHSL